MQYFGRAADRPAAHMPPLVPDGMSGLAEATPASTLGHTLCSLSGLLSGMPPLVHCQLHNLRTGRAAAAAAAADAPQRTQAYF